MSAANWSEVVAKLAQRGHPDPAIATEAVRALGICVVVFTADHALAAGLLWPAARGAEFSLGDRACLALAAAIADSTALATDRAWVGVPGRTAVQLLR